LAKLWLRTEAAGQSSQLLSISKSHTDGLEPSSFLMRKSSPNLYLINNYHFNSIFGTGESCQQKLWSLVPQPPTEHENTQQGIAAASFIENLNGGRVPFLLNLRGPCPAQWGPEDHQS